MFGFRHRGSRKNLFPFCIAVVSITATGFAADTAADLVFGKVRAGIAADLADFRGAVCMESVERIRYAPRKPNRNVTCGELLADAANSPLGAITWRSRLRLDVKAGAAAENFSLTEVSGFERNDVGGLLSAATAGSGEFSTFLGNLIAGDGDPFQSGGVQQTPLGNLLAFEFAVPTGKSRFLYAAGGGASPVRTAYHGSLFAIPQSGDLRRLTIEAEDAGDACRVRYTTDYMSTRLGGREIVLPQTSTMEAVLKNGEELRSETYYSGYRRPVAPATTAAASTAKPLPPRVRLRVRFDPPIDSETAATGDPVIGVIRATVKDKRTGVIVHAGDRLHGRITLIEERFSPDSTWNIAIAFETIERGVGEHGIDQGVEQPVSLVPMDDGDREPHDDSADAAHIQILRPPGGGYFILHGLNVVLDQKYETEWETR